MTEHQFTVLANMLELSEPDRAAARRVIFDNDKGDAVAKQFLVHFATLLPWHSKILLSMPKL